jgi:flagellar hook-associated protein 2
MSTSSTSAGTFTGSSAFSASLAQEITNAVNIASIPMNNLQTQQTTLQGQQTELGTLSGDFTSLGTALSTIDSSTGSSSYAATTSNTNVASASVGSGVMAGTYSLTVSKTGANTTTMSDDGLTKVTDPTQSNISSSTDFTLVVNSTSYDISNSDGTLDGLANAINASGANVQATVVNVGSSSSPDYRLSVKSLDFAPDGIQLEDTGNNNAALLEYPPLTSGAYVQYSVNGESTVSSTSQSLTLSPGLTVNVLGTGSTTITVAQNGNSIANALSSFATAYNAAVAEVGKNRGQNTGALNGDATIFSLTESLNDLANYTASSGSITSLSQLGLTFDQNGNLDFNQSTFDQAASSNMTDVLNFLGSVSGDTGFLGAANDILTGINDPTNGLLPQETANLASENTGLGNSITDDQTQITQLQQNLTAQMSAADASIATLEQQASYLQTMFQTENADAQLGY